MPAYFWGDLDFAGMGILKALRQNLHNIEPWPAGYEAMELLLDQGKGHSAQQANKWNQSDPGLTGSDYADTVLLPKLRQLESFVDQEAVTPKGADIP